MWVLLLSFILIIVVNVVISLMIVTLGWGLHSWYWHRRRVYLRPQIPWWEFCPSTHDRGPAFHVRSEYSILSLLFRLFTFMFNNFISHVLICFEVYDLRVLVSSISRYLHRLAIFLMLCIFMNVLKLVHCWNLLLSSLVADVATSLYMACKFLSISFRS